MIVPMDIRNITKRITEGEKLFKLLKEYEIAPLIFFQHLDKHPEDKLIFERARQISVEILIDELDSEITGALDRFELDKAKVKISHRSWLAEKLIPSTYGQRIEHNVHGQIDIKAVLAEANSRVATIKVVPNIIAIKSLKDAEEEKVDNEVLQSVDDV